jgi:hypothetical protein
VQGVTAVYATGAKQSGEALRASDTTGADVLVVVGRDWDALHHRFAAPRRAPRTAGASSTTTTTVGSGTTVPAPTTTTTLAAGDRRFIPVDPKTGGILVGCPKS